MKGVLGNSLRCLGMRNGGLRVMNIEEFRGLVRGVFVTWRKIIRDEG